MRASTRYAVFAHASPLLKPINPSQTARLFQAKKETLHHIISYGRWNKSQKENRHLITLFIPSCNIFSDLVNLFQFHDSASIFKLLMVVFWKSTPQYKHETIFRRFKTLYLSILSSVEVHPSSKRRKMCLGKSGLMLMPFSSFHHLGKLDRTF